VPPATAQHAVRGRALDNQRWSRTIVVLRRPDDEDDVQ
jgi:hypothetical protein